MREAGRIVARVHEAMREMVRPGVTTAELDARAEEIIRAHDAIPTFLGYPHTGKNDFPASICASINEELVHGIPSPKRWLEPGDIISIDVGAIYQGWVGDSAWTYAVGDVDDESRSACWRRRKARCGPASRQARAGNFLADISRAVETLRRAARLLGGARVHGHGVGRRMHEEPQVLNYRAGGRGQGPRLQAGHDAGARADGERRHLAHPGAGRWLDGGDGRRQAVGALRAHASPSPRASRRF